MFALLPDTSVSTRPNRKALFISFSLHISLCACITWLLLTALPPVRFALMNVRAGIREPVRVPQLSYPAQRRPSSAAVRRDAGKAARSKQDILVQHSQQGGADRQDYGPTALPPDISALLDADMPQPSSTIGIEHGNPLTVTSLLSGPVPDPPEPPPGNPDIRSPIVLGANLEPAKLLEQAIPVYPGLARTARVEGIVVLEGTVNVKGRIENLHVISGHPMLAEAAIRAVEKWKYRPAKLNGQLVPQPVSVQVRFTLAYPHN
jgi:TonB family protein